MHKHTPGPWTLDFGNIGIDIKNHVAVNASDHGGFAQVVWVMDEDASESKNTPTCEANARLIAAAPDLLEAAQQVIPPNLCLTNTNISDDEVVTLDITINELRKVAASIAKATGQ